MRQKFLKYLAAAAVSLMAVLTAQAQVGTGGLVFFGDRVVKESIASTAPVTQLAGGRHFSIAVRADGSIAAWGADNYGQCDIAPFMTNAKQVAAGQDHALILLSDGTVKALGFNNYGQATVPPGLSNVVQIACGQYTSYALKSDGTIAVWGWLAAGLAPPPGLTNVKQIAAGQATAMALKNDGTIVFWGSNDHNEENFTQGANNVTGISFAYEHGVAVRSDGTVSCWGNNDYLQSNVPSGLSAVAVFAGPTHTLALKADGTVVAWGSTGSGEITVPSTVKNIKTISAGESTSFAIDANGKVFGWGDSLFGQSVIPNAMYDVQKIAAGWNHVMLLKHDGSLGAWGQNTQNQCNLVGLPTSGYTDVTAGQFHTAASGAPLPINDVFGDNYWMQCTISGTNYDHFWAFGANTYAHKIGGGVDAYGKNSDGEFGLATQGDFVQITGGQFHALGLRANGTVVAAGIDNFGQLDIPAGLANVQQISSGYGTNLALLANGTVAAWGLNDSGQRNVPASLPTIYQVAAGHEHSVALTGAGGVIAWGGNGNGQTSIPDGFTGMAQIGAGEYFTVCLPKVSLSVAPYSVYGLSQATGTVYIPAPAGPNGVSITMSSNSSFASPKTVVVVPAGLTTTTFPITTTNPDVPTQAVITATLGGLTENALLTVKPTAFTMGVSIPSVVGGSTYPLSMFVTLTKPAPPGGADVTVVSSDPSVIIPGPVHVTGGNLTGTLTLSDARVKVSTPVTITGSYGNTVATSLLTVTPFKVTFLKMTPGIAVAGTPAAVSVYINSVPVLPVAVNVASSDNTAIPGPFTITVPALTNNASTTITAGSVTTNVSVLLTATLDGSSISSVVGVAPAISIDQSVASVIGGSTNPANLTITLPVAAPVGGATITMSASDPSVYFTLPVVVPAGQTTLTIPILTKHVHANTVVDIYATYGVTKAGLIFTVNPFKVSNFTLSATTVDGSGPTYGTVTLNATPLAAIAVSITSSDNTTVPGPVTLTVNANSASGTAPIKTNPVATNKSVTLTANLDGSVYGTPLTVDAALSKITLSAGTAYGATSLTATVTLQIAAPVGGISFGVTTANCHVQTPIWTIGAGQTQATFPVSANDLSSNGQMSVTANLGPQSLVATATIIPNRISTFTVTPTTFIGLSRTVVTATFTIAAPVVYDVYINPSSSSPALAALPAPITIKAGTKSTTVTVTHGKATKSTAVTLTGTRAGASKTATVTVH